ncbi:hypothetical protein ACMXYO_10120 [Neptuniibacter sp. QD37_6]|uniref:hypothetical protein n=1 Tax=Neptuniibacter sp. QD37_6 TaxID=3398210 RepID=UPI0039F4A753
MSQLLSEGLKPSKRQQARHEYEARRDKRIANLKSQGRHLEAMLQHMNCPCSVSPNGRSVQMHQTKPIKERK